MGKCCDAKGKIINERERRWSLRTSYKVADYRGDSELYALCTPSSLAEPHEAISTSHRNALRRFIRPNEGGVLSPRIIAIDRNQNPDVIRGWFRITYLRRTFGKLSCNEISLIQCAGRAFHKVTHPEQAT